MHIEWPTCIDTAPGKINWCQIWPANTQGARNSQLALCIQWLSRQTIKSRRENIVWDLKTCWDKQNVDLQMSTYKCRLIRKIVYTMYRDGIQDFTNMLTYLECRDYRCRDNECWLFLSVIRYLVILFKSTNAKYWLDQSKPCHLCYQAKYFSPFKTVQNSLIEQNNIWLYKLKNLFLSFSFEG